MGNCSGFAVLDIGVELGIEYVWSLQGREMGTIWEKN